MFFLLFFFPLLTLPVSVSSLLQVSILGVIREFDPYVMNIEYTVDDMTGPPLNVKQWVNTEASSIKSLSMITTVMGGGGVYYNN